MSGAACVHDWLGDGSFFATGVPIWGVICTKCLDYAEFRYGSGNPRCDWTEFHRLYGTLDTMSESMRKRCGNLRLEAKGEIVSVFLHPRQMATLVVMR